MSLVKKRVYRVLIIMLILGSFTPVSIFSKSAEGAMVSSQMLSSDGSTASRSISEEKIRRMLENKIVAERLKSYGLSKEEVLEKMSKMSDEQVHQLAALSDRIPAGRRWCCNGSGFGTCCFCNSYTGPYSFKKDLMPLL
ncbi:MAG: hypothetical protein KatS3mg078_2107 [Deltaproteobacteria bacterium]|nr:MAG: hypothetical protein KatS3mg078_2107 [Deltaproteobacteria bacterium]